MLAKWKKGYRTNLNAQTAFNELEEIKEKNAGVLTAGIVVEKAKHKSNKLHNAFEWDNEIAGAEYRLEQARRMLRSIEVIYPESKNDKPHRHYMTVKEHSQNGMPERKVYKSTKEILQDPIERDELLSQAIREAISYRKKYAQLSELATVFKALDNFVSNAKINI